MKAAEKTVDFVKQWVHGIYTKRQYQNWYTVKTDHSEFLLTLTDKRDLYAIKDRKSGHIYLMDDGISVNNGRVTDANDENPFVILFQQGFEFPSGYSRIANLSGSYSSDPEEANLYDPNNLRNHLSKWRVCEIKSVPIGALGAGIKEPTSISLIAIGDRRFYTFPAGTPPAHKAKINLSVWASFQYEANFTCSDFPLRGYRLRELSNRPGIEKVDDIRGHYLELAGNKLKETYMYDNNWIVYPTDYTEIDQIAGFALLQARKSRPNPFHYNISPSISDYSRLSRRHETIAENGEFLKDCISLDGDKEKNFHSANWESHIQKHLPKDLADSYISFFKDDDAWLENNREVARASYLEYALRLNTSDVKGWLFVKPSTDDRFGPFEIYMRSEKQATFSRLVPSPQFHGTVFGGLMGGDRIESI